MIRQSDIQKYLDDPSNKTLAMQVLLAVLAAVRDGGTLYIGGCDVGRGDQGSHFSKTLNALLKKMGRNITVVLPHTPTRIGLGGHMESAPSEAVPDPGSNKGSPGKMKPYIPYLPAPYLEFLP